MQDDCKGGTTQIGSALYGTCESTRPSTTLLGLRFGEDLTVPDIASTLEIRLGTAKARLHRALRRLRKEIGMTMKNDDEERIGRRLRRELLDRARAQPLPGDFVVRVADLLPARPQARLRSRWLMMIDAAAIVLETVAELGVAGSSLLRPSNPGTSQASGSPESALVTYSSGGLSFDYPAAWTVIASGISARGNHQYIPVVLGTGDWQLNCHSIAPSGDVVSGTSCGADNFVVDAGEAVVALYISSGEASGPNWTPPPAAEVLVSGLRATVTEGATSSRWLIYVPGSRYPWWIEAHYAEPNVEAARAQVRTLVETLQFVPR
jgi:hypothetical protein